MGCTREFRIYPTTRNGFLASCLFSRYRWSSQFLNMPRTPLAPVAHQNVPILSAEKLSRDDDDSSPGGEMSIEETVTIINELSALLQKDDGGSLGGGAQLKQLTPRKMASS